MSSDERGELLKRLVRPAYFRYVSWKADRDHVKPERTRSTVTDAPAHVLCVVVDALRPDFVPDVPLDFGTAIAPSTWTFPSVTSVHTGQYPHEHGSVAHTQIGDDQFAMPSQASPSDTLPGCFEAAGYDTFAGCAFPMPFLAVEGWYQTHRVWSDAPADRVIDRYRSWRRRRDRTFGYLHLGDVHAPITLPESYVEAYDVDTSLPNLQGIHEYTDDYDGSEACVRYRRHRLRLYEAAVAYVADQLRPLLSEVRDDTHVVLIGDHGEAHWEHYELDRQFTDSRPNYGVGHGGTPFDMVARVPVGVSTPDGTDLGPKGGWASLTDLPRTLVSGVVDDVPFPRRDWRRPIPEDRTVLSEGTRYGAERKAAYRGREKLVRSAEDGVSLAATVSIDEPGERFVGERSSISEDLTEAFPDDWEFVHERGETNRIVEDQLQALGYK